MGNVNMTGKTTMKGTLLKILLYTDSLRAILSGKIYQSIHGLIVWRIPDKNTVADVVLLQDFILDLPDRFAVCYAITSTRRSREYAVYYAIIFTCREYKPVSSTHSPSLRSNQVKNLEVCLFK